MENINVPRGKDDASFISRLITMPFLISIFYGVVLSISGNSWWWLVSAVLMCVIVFLTLTWSVMIGKPKGFPQLLTYYFLELIAMILLTPLTLRLAFYDGFWQLIQSVLHFNLTGIIFAIISIYFGQKMCIFFNRVYQILK